MVQWNPWKKTKDEDASLTEEDKKTFPKWHFDDGTPKIFPDETQESFLARVQAWEQQTGKNYTVPGDRFGKSLSYRAANNLGWSGKLNNVGYQNTAAFNRATENQFKKDEGMFIPTLDQQVQWGGRNQDYSKPGSILNRSEELADPRSYMIRNDPTRKMNLADEEKEKGYLINQTEAQINKLNQDLNRATQNNVVAEAIPEVQSSSGDGSVNATKQVDIKSSNPNFIGHKTQLEMEQTGYGDYPNESPARNSVRQNKATIQSINNPEGKQNPSVIPEYENLAATDRSAMFNNTNADALKAAGKDFNAGVEAGGLAEGGMSFGQGLKIATAIAGLFKKKGSEGTGKPMDTNVNTDQVVPGKDPWTNYYQW